MIVDDDASLAGTLAIALRCLGFAVGTAHNGMRGSSSYFRDSADWLITDIEKMEFDGIEMMPCFGAVNPTVKTIYLGE